MNMLKTKAFGGLLLVLIVMAALLFLVAGTLNYWQVWAVVAVFGAAGLVVIMYCGSLLYLLGIPIALGSWWGALVILLMTPAGIWRIFDEENS